MAKFGESSDLVKCSFCGKSQTQVGKLIAGPGVYICNECVELCNDIIDGERIDEEAVGVPPVETKPSAEHTASVVEAGRRLTSALGGSPTVAELANESNLDEDKVIEILRRLSSGAPGSTAAARRTDEPNLVPVAVALRMIQHEMDALSEWLAALVERVKRVEDS